MMNASLNNQPRQKLQQIIATYGPSICNKPTRCKGLLLDYCGKHRREVNILISALEEQVASDLLNMSTGTPYEVLQARLEKRLYENLGMAEQFARWGIQSWAIALGILTEEELENHHARLEDGSDVQEISRPKLVQRIIVSRKSDGDYTSIAEAIKQAKPYARIIIRPGFYQESITLDKPVEIVGEAESASSGIQSIILEGRAPCISMQTSQAMIQGLLVRGKRGKRNKDRDAPAVAISRGQLILRNCDITSDTELCIRVQGSTTKSVIQDCLIHRSNSKGLLFTDNAGGSVEGCIIENHLGVSVYIEQSSFPSFKNCTISQGGSIGIVVTTNSRLHLKNCTIANHSSHNVAVIQGGNLDMQEGNSSYSQANGLFLDQPGQVRVSGYKMYGNGNSGIEIHNGKNLYISDSRMYNNTSHGVEVAGETTLQLERCQIVQNKRYGLLVHDKGQITIADCDIHDNALEPQVYSDNGSVIHQMTDGHA